MSRIANSVTGGHVTSQNTNLLIFYNLAIAVYSKENKLNSGDT